jgi:hypothetical protein
MKTRQVWLEIVLAGTAISIALGLFLSCIGAVAGMAEAPDDAQASTLSASENTHSTEQVFEGMVTCSHCGARHSPALQRPATVCVRVCVHGGSSFALVNGESSYLLEGDSQSLKRFAGERARVLGTLHGHTIQVRSVAADT